MLGSFSSSALNSVYVYQGFQGAFSAVMGAPSIFINSFLSSLIANNNNPESIVLESNSLTEAEAHTEISLNTLLENCYKQLEEDYQTAVSARSEWYKNLNKQLGEDYQKGASSRAKWYKDFDRKVVEKSLGQLLKDKDIKPTRDAILVAVKSILETGKELNPDSPQLGSGIVEDFQKIEQGFSGFIGSLLKQVSNFGGYLGEIFLKDFNSLNGTARDLFLVGCIGAELLLELKKEHIKLPYDMMYAAIAGVIEGAGKTFMHSRGTEVRAESREEIINKILSPVEEYMKSYNAYARKVEKDNKVLESEEKGSIFVRVKKVKKAKGLSLREVALKNGGISKTTLAVSDYIRSAVHGGKMFLNSTVAELAKFAGSSVTELSQYVAPRLMQYYKGDAPQKDTASEIGRKLAKEGMSKIPDAGFNSSKYIRSVSSYKKPNKQR